MEYRPSVYRIWTGYAKLALLLLHVSKSSGVCDFPDGFVSRTYWLRGRDDGTSALSLVTYSRTEINVRRNSDLGTVTERYECGEFGGSGTFVLYIRQAQGSSVSVCVEETIQGTDYITHRETNITSTATLADCSSQFMNVDEFSIYPPVTDPSPSNFRLALSTNYRLTSGNYYLQYRLAPGLESQCAGDTTSALSVYWDRAILAACDRESHSDLPLSGYLTSVTVIQPSVLGESYGPASQGILLLMWSGPSSDVKQIFCVRYSLNGSSVQFSFDVTTASSAVCRKSAEPGWSGDVNGRRYMLMDLQLFYSGTTILTTLSRSPFSPTSPGVTPTVPPQVTCRVQFTFYDVMYSDINELWEFAQDLEGGLSSALVVTADRISNVVIQEGFSGRAVFTFDLHPPDDLTSAGPISFDLERFRSNVHTGLYTIVVQGQTYTFHPDSIYHWEDTDPCPTSRCLTPQLCWVLQGARECVDSPPRLIEPTGGDDGGGGGGGLSQSAIIGIAVACAAVVLVAVVVTVLLVIRMRDRRGKDATTDSSSAGPGDGQERPVYTWNQPIIELPYSMNRGP